LKPEEGSFLKETEIWIKGSNFTDNIAVTIGGHLSKIIDIKPNLITCLSPVRPDLEQKSITVDVVVSCRFAEEGVKVAEKKLEFTYIQEKQSSSSN